MEIAGIVWTHTEVSQRAKMGHHLAVNVQDHCGGTRKACFQNLARCTKPGGTKGWLAGWDDSQLPLWAVKSPQQQQGALGQRQPPAWAQLRWTDRPWPGPWREAWSCDCRRLPPAGSTPHPQISPMAFLPSASCPYFSCPEWCLPAALQYHLWHVLPTPGTQGQGRCCSLMKPWFLTPCPSPSLLFPFNLFYWKPLSRSVCLSEVNQPTFVFHRLYSFCSNRWSYFFLNRTSFKIALLWKKHKISGAHHLRFSDKAAPPHQASN